MRGRAVGTKAGMVACAGRGDAMLAPAMCGINGALRLTPGAPALAADELREVRDRLAARGPDGAGLWLSPDGRVVSEAEWNAKVGEWLPTAEDRAFVQSLMGRVVEPGKFANWIAPPVMGINRQPVDFEYVRFN